LWTLKLETAQAAQLVTAPELGQVTSARWSPDGRRLAYALAEVRDRRIPVSEVYLLSEDGGNRQRVLSSEGGALFHNPTWAPDGNQLFLVRTSASAGERIRRIERVDIATGSAEPVLDNEVGPFDIDATGRRLALVRANEQGMSLVVVDLASGEQRVLVPEREFEVIAAPRFTRQSDAIIFSAAGTVSGVDLPGSPWAGLWTVFAPTALAHGLPQDVYSIPIDGGRPRRVAQVSADDPSLAPSPDGGHIAILSPEALATLPVSGGAVSSVLVPGGYGSVDWAQ
jgi:Tol biopolymer transport system component